jgi:hypothetical protein
MKVSRTHDFASMSESKMKWLRRYLLVVSLISILTSIFEILSYVAPFALGILSLGAVDSAKLSMAVLALAFGGGLLWLRNWARIGMAALLSFRALSIVLTVAMMRQLPNALGYVLMGVVILIYVALIALLVMAAPVTRDSEERVSGGWKIAGLLAAIFGGGIYCLAFIDFEPKRMEDLPVVTKKVLPELTGKARWQLQRVSMLPLINGDLKREGTDVGILSLDERDGTLSGIPEFKSFRVRFDASRGGLALNDMIFVGENFQTKRFLWQDLPTKGAQFSNESSPVSGTITFGFVAGDTLYIVLKLTMYGRDVEVIYRGARLPSGGSGTSPSGL